ncbi:hypothetical protein [Actinokineospora iranica]|uniref:Uncharacterized protein n=1 Tax=Actinokineospora iranica TaxID=1271860 RepID=A0A1G6U6U9_9PSEU|nr:hypothetical protein [Actinokineospora iranica]SDD37039.1 hypothetical protein SAMN05216174_110136 [Actinokineospora iranica]
MVDPSAFENFKTTAMLRAEQLLGDAAERAQQAAAKAQREHDEKKRAEQPPSKEEIDNLKAYATGPKAAPEWRRVVEKIEAGQLSWEAIASGKVGDDPDFSAAVSAQNRLAAERAVAAQQQKSQRDWDDDDFSNNSFMDKRRP